MSQYDFPHTSPDLLQRDVEARRSEAEGVGGAKQPKESVNYRDAGSSDTRCGTCMHFSPGMSGSKGSCDLVEGIVSSGGVSDLYDGGSDSVMDIVRSP